MLCFAVRAKWEKKEMPGSNSGWNSLPDSVKGNNAAFFPTLARRQPWREIKPRGERETLKKTKKTANPHRSLAHELWRGNFSLATRLCCGGSCRRGQNIGTAQTEGLGRAGPGRAGPERPSPWAPTDSVQSSSTTEFLLIRNYGEHLSCPTGGANHLRREAAIRGGACQHLQWECWTQQHLSEP
ncbi:hypothetical protein D4764_01G0001110 [Takifugu flavidus]|uniref:Uncharacterized protein n=1 Tax=Takifugu flavidus TaxID=433684 RepID=A0A5C6PN28_9TELE|nr:hypothetical protein D4764_01G0001110 [Takifugu flavidus]